MNTYNHSNKIILLFLLSLLNLHCQMQNKLPEFHTEICHPNNKLPITPVYDYIKTLENTPAGLPYGSSSGHWGSSGKGWTEQHGTPIGFEITYYAHYENKYYYIDADFDQKFIKEMVSRCYIAGDQDSRVPVKDYINAKEWLQTKGSGDKSYEPFSDLVFGFAPKGMVVVWMRYGGANNIDIGRFQAKEVTDLARIEEYKKKYKETYRLEGNRYEEAIKEDAIPDASPLVWDNYRLQYNWNFRVSSENLGFRFLKYEAYHYSGEIETLISPVTNTPPNKKRTLPEKITLYWETSANERYEGRLFFDWNKLHLQMQEAGPNPQLQIKINKNNTQIEVRLNDKIVETDSVRMYSQSHLRFRDSYGGPYSD